MFWGGALGLPDDFVEKAAIKVGVWRRSLTRFVREAASDLAGGLAAVLASGDRSDLAQAYIDALRGAGLAHLLVSAICPYLGTLSSCGQDALDWFRL